MRRVREELADDLKRVSSCVHVHALCACVCTDVYTCICSYEELADDLSLVSLLANEPNDPLDVDHQRHQAHPK